MGPCFPRLVARVVSSGRSNLETAPCWSALDGSIFRLSNSVYGSYESSFSRLEGFGGRFRFFFWRFGVVVVREGCLNLGLNLMWNSPWIPSSDDNRFVFVVRRLQSAGLLFFANLCEFICM